MRNGIVIAFNPFKCVGFIQSRNPKDHACRDTFFFHTARVVFCKRNLSEIQPGMFAQFKASQSRPKQPDHHPYAIDVELFDAAPAAPVSAGLSVLAGNEKSDGVA